MKGAGPDVSYEVVLPESRLILTYKSPRAEPDVISLQLQDLTGAVIGAFAADEPDDSPRGLLSGALTVTGTVTGSALIPPEPQAVNDWKLLQELFSEVHLSATGWDRVVKDVEKALASQGPIGKPKHS
jgi:hypothetical protein